MTNDRLLFRLRLKVRRLAALTPAAILLLAVLSASARAIDLEEYFGDYLFTLEEEETPVRYTDCRFPGGKALFILAEEEHGGLLVELEHGAVVNLATVVMQHGKPVVDETHGGDHSYKRIADLLRRMLRLPFRLVAPGDLTALIESRPKAACK
jgi:hypothetical protein